MEPKIVSPLPETWLTGPVQNEPAPVEYRGLRWAFIGSQGLRAGWSILLGCFFFFLLQSVIGYIFFRLHLIGKSDSFTATWMFFGESIDFLALLWAVALMALLEGRKLHAYNLAGPKRTLHFLGGSIAGFAALSALVGALAWGGWLHFGPMALSGAAIFKFGAAWGGVFLMVGCFEEGAFRGYLQYTLSRGINFWWALAVISVVCADLVLRTKGNGTWGVYGAALLGLVPCLMLHWKKTEGNSFWQAAWVTSTLFGYIHTSNGGENWIGIFAAALIGFVFCVSIRVTGSAWWAIGCHTAWDWAESYFYGTADSGMVAQGHYLTTSVTGNALWSGGADGPEGSLLVLPVILGLLLLLALYAWKKATAARAQKAALAV